MEEGLTKRVLLRMFGGDNATPEMPLGPRSDLRLSIQIRSVVLIPECTLMPREKGETESANKRFLTIESTASRRYYVPDVATVFRTGK